MRSARMNSIEGVSCGLLVGGLEPEIHSARRIVSSVIAFASAASVFESFTR
jgi:hypothetical protein